MSRRIALQTRQWIIDALLELLVTQAFSQISVAQICHQAQVSRNTFYRKFTDKRAVVRAYAEQLTSEYEYLVRENKPQTFNALVHLPFKFADQHRPVLRLLQQNNLLEVVQAAFTQLGPRLYTAVDLPWHTVESPEAVSIMMQFFTGAFWNVVVHWLDDSAHSVDEMTNLVVSGLTAVTPFITGKNEG
ncbi:TetR/AcrR family transcriptional regulator [Ligilactobacillus sp. LYQ60]|uniref:TetR/AcrR family transcriptional regulator n=1 Tax=unclassified Ligilactobacillus TaxID=2767920 RepID=UPI003854B77C